MSGEQAVDRRKPEAAKQSADDITELSGKNKANQAEEERRTSLLSMLRASEERYERASSRRSGPLAAGIMVDIVGGTLSGISAEVLDADYISNRVLLALPEHDGPHWVAFRHVMAINKP